MLAFITRKAPLLSIITENPVIYKEIEHTKRHTMSDPSERYTALYIRVSTKDQQIDRQISDCKQSLTQAQLDNFKIYADQGSGSTADREEFQQLVADIKSEKIDTVVTTEISRISRNASIFTTFLEVCTKHQTGLKPLQSGFPTIEPESKFGKLIGQIMASVAEMEWEMTRDRIKSGLQEAERQGKWTSRPPYGFSTDDEGYLVVDPVPFLKVITAIENIEDGSSIYKTAQVSGIPESTLRDIYNTPSKRSLYIKGESENEQKQKAIDDAEVESESELTNLWDSHQEIKEDIQEIKSKLD
jgi:DNA invertase Pin-like site-specific DNA recombinase